MVQWKRIQLGTMRLQVRSIALLRGLRIQRCYELGCRLRSGIAVAGGEASSYSSKETPSLGTAMGGALKRQTNKQTKNKQKNPYMFKYDLFQSSLSGKQYK